MVTACGGPSTPPDASAGQAASGGSSVVNFANFADEIGPQTLARFEQETGLRVNYEVYESNLALESRLLVGQSGLDLVVPGNNFLQRQIQAKAYQPLDRSQLPNWKHLDPAILAMLERNDPGNRHAVPYLWGTTSLGYNVDQVESVLGGQPPDSWALLFDPRYASKLQKCGIAVLDSPWLMVSFALLYLGRDPNSERPGDLADAMQVLMAIRPFVRNITTMPMAGPLAEGEYCLVVAPSADFRAAREAARSAGRPVNLHYLIPKEGTIMWIDTLAVPVDAPHPRNALRLMNYLMRPDVAADVTNSIHLATANADASAMLSDETRNDPAVYPTPEEMSRLRMNAALSDEFTRLENREFTRFRTGR